jgi:anti-anti-sigma factor
MTTQIGTNSLADTPLLEIEGDIDHSSAAAFERAVDEALEKHPAVLIDLTKCPYLDSGGLAVLLFATRRLDADGWIGVIGSSPNLLRLFEVVGLTANPAFRLFDEVSAAKESLALDAH